MFKCVIASPGVTFKMLTVKTSYAEAVQHGWVNFSPSKVEACSTPSRLRVPFCIC